MDARNYPGEDDKIIWDKQHVFSIDDYKNNRGYQKRIDSLIEIGIEQVRDASRPCRGANINICVGEGCFNNACIKDKFKE